MLGKIHARVNTHKYAFVAVMSVVKQSAMEPKCTRHFHKCNKRAALSRMSVATEKNHLWPIIWQNKHEVAKILQAARKQNST